MRLFLHFLVVVLLGALTVSCVTDTVVDSASSSGGTVAMPIDGMNLVIVHRDTVFRPSLDAPAGLVDWGDGQVTGIRCGGMHRYTGGGWRCVTVTTQGVDTVSLGGLGGVTSLTVCLP